MCVSVGVALLCSFLLGLGDSCFNTQLLSIIGFRFRDNSAPAFAIFKFIQVGMCFCFRGVLGTLLLKLESSDIVMQEGTGSDITVAVSPHLAVVFAPQSILAALAFFYSNFLLLHWQLLIMVVLGFAGSLSFFVAEWRAQAAAADGI